MKQKEDRDLKYIVVLFVGVLIVVGLGILYKSGKIFQPSQEQCGVVVSRETREDGFVNDKTYGVVRMQTGYKSFALVEYAVVGDTICQEGNGGSKKDYFISY